MCLGIPARLTTAGAGFRVAVTLYLLLLGRCGIDQVPAG